MDNIKKLLAHARKNKEGFTVKVEKGKLIPVSGTKNERYSVAGDTSIVYSPKSKKLKVISPPKADGFYGGWYDKKNKRYLIEHVNLYPSRKKALLIGKRRKQIAIFDLVKMHEIPVQYASGMKVTGITERRTVVVRKGKRYLNTLTGKYVNERTANQLNRYFEKHPHGTLYEAQRRPVYDSKKLWIDQPEAIRKMYKKKKVLVVKTKDIHGKDVYISPSSGKRVSNRLVEQTKKLDYVDGIFNIKLYRVSSNRQTVYHIAKTFIGHTIKETDDITALYQEMDERWLHPAMRLIPELARKHPIAKNMFVVCSFNHDVYVTTVRAKDTGCVNFFYKYLVTDINMLPDELRKAMDTYRMLLMKYNVLVIKDVTIYIHSNNPSEKAIMLSKHRLGVLNRNGN